MRRIPGYFHCLIFLCITTSAVLLAQSQPNGATTPAAAPLNQEVSYPGLAAKAPGAPGYGLQITSDRGKFMLTDLYYDPMTKKASVQVFRITGPAGWGPYRSGITVSHHEASQPPPGYGGDRLYFENYYNLSVEKGSPSDKAGLHREKYDARIILGVDGNNFGWDAGALEYYISNRPEIKVDTAKFGMFTHRETFHFKTEKIQSPPDPADGGFVSPSDNDGAIIVAWLNSGHTANDLLVLRSKLDRYAPLAFELNGKKLWVVYSTGAPEKDKPTPRIMEFWKEDPSTGPVNTGIYDVWPVPADGMRVGRILRVMDTWYQVKAFATDPATGRLTQFEMAPWSDVETLLTGKSLADDMGEVNLPGVREQLEGTANDQLIEWKTRTLPGLLAKEPAAALEERVIHLEKGLLALDTQVRHIHEKVDELARAKADQQAAAQKPGQPQAAAPASTDAANAELEHLADALTQRQAILQAILASTKQALAQVRR